MELVLRWQSLVFYIPLAVGIVLALGVATGAADDEPDEPDSSPLDVGRVPLIVLATMAALLFGGIGVVVSAVLGATTDHPTGPAIVALWFASFGSVTLTRAAARVMQRVMPTSETYCVTRRELVGRSGKLILPANESSGLAQVRDREGNVHQVRCLTSGGVLARGTEVVVVEHREESNVYVVTPFTQ